ASIAFAWAPRAAASIRALTSSTRFRRVLPSPSAWRPANDARRIHEGRPHPGNVSFERYGPCRLRAREARPQEARRRRRSALSRRAEHPPRPAESHRASETRRSLSVRRPTLRAGRRRVPFELTAMHRPEDEIRAAILRFATPASGQIDALIARGRRAHF